jgi:hypothetical protein
MDRLMTRATNDTRDFFNDVLGDYTFNPAAPDCSDRRDHQPTDDGPSSPTPPRLNPPLPSSGQLFE